MTTPRTADRRRLLAGLAALAIVLAAGGAAAAYQLFLTGDNVAPLALDPSPSAQPAASAAASPAASAAASTTASAGTATDGVAGTWNVGAGSVAGYRVREMLGFADAESDAVGRTEDVTGSVELAQEGGGVTVTGGTITVDLTTLTSDEDRRDNRLRSMGIQTDQFPAATFVATSPVAVPAEALGGTTVDISLVGDLTLHGVTKSVTIPAQARLDGSSIEVVGSLRFPFADFEIEPPNIANFVTVHEDGTLEFKLVLTR
jgi:polyisoprenoid-binding protein YceI